MTLPSGTRIGAYEIRSLLGAGGMGEVYRATDTKLSRDVALKVLPPQFVSNPGTYGAFRTRSPGSCVMESSAHCDHSRVGRGRINFDLHPDGQRFVVVKVPEGSSLTRNDQVVFIFNFFDELRRIAPASK